MFLLLLTPLLFLSYKFLTVKNLKNFDDDYNENKSNNVNEILYYEAFFQPDKNKDNKVVNYKESEKFSDIDFAKIRELREKNCEVICVNYIYNGEFLKYNMNLNCKNLLAKYIPFQEETPLYKYYPEFIFIDDYDITDIVKKYMGPDNDFLSKYTEQYIETILLQYPHIHANIDFDKADFIIISSEKLLGKRAILRPNIKSKLIFKTLSFISPIESFDVIRNSDYYTQDVVDLVINFEKNEKEKLNELNEMNKTN